MSNYIIDGAQAPLSPVGAKLFGADVSGNVGYVKQPRSQYIKRVALLGDSLSDLGNGSATITNLVQSGGVATATCGTHYNLPGSLVHITGSNQAGYNGWHIVTASTPTTIQFAVPADTVSPATTPVVIRMLSQQRITGQSWFQWAASKLGGAVQQVLNAGVGGDNTTQAAERVDYIIGTDADTVVVLLGHNDVFWDEAADTDAAFARYVAICGRFINAGMRVISPTLISTPLASGVGYVCRQKAARFNVLLRDWAQETDGVIFVDLHAAIVDPTSDVAISRANVQAPDNVHLSVYGAQVFGSVLAAAMRPFVQVHNILPSSALPIAENLCTNPTLRGTGGYTGNASGAAPLAFRSAMFGSGTWASSVVARAVEADGDDVGNNAVLTTASSTAYDVVLIGTIDVISIVSPGDVLWGCAHLQITNPDAFAGFNFGVYIKRGSDEYWATASEWFGGLETNMNNVNGVFRTPNVVVPADATFVSFMLMGTVVNAGEAVTVKIGRVGLFKE